MKIRAVSLSVLFGLCAAGTALGQATVTESDTRTEFGNITSYRSYGGYGGAYNGGYNGGYNRYPEQQPRGGYDAQYNRPRPQQRPWADPPSSQLGPDNAGNSRNRNQGLNTAPSRYPRQHGYSSRPWRESSEAIRQRYRTPYDRSEYRDSGPRGFSADQYRRYGAPGAGMGGTGDRARRPVQPLEEGALPEGGSDDAHYITR